jgi:hypothetical protein
MSKLVVVEDGTVFRMINDDVLAKQISCLYGKKSIFKNIGSAGCGACARKRTAQKQASMTQIKVCLTGLSLEKRQILKDWLGADEVRVVYTNAGGKVVQVNF